jgi:hypothetical protein
MKLVSGMTQVTAMAQLVPLTTSYPIMMGSLVIGQLSLLAMLVWIFQ